MATTTYEITKRREDGETYYDVDDQTFDTLAEAREWIRFERNQEMADEAQALIGDLDFNDPATARKLKTIMAYLKK